MSGTGGRSTVATSSIEIPKFDVDEELSGRGEIGGLRETLLTKAETDTISRLDGTNSFDRTDEIVIRCVLLPGRRTSSICLELFAKFPHLIIRSEQY